MIKINSTLTSMGLAALMADKGYTLIPRPSSIVSELVRLSSVNLTDSLPYCDNIENNVHMLAEALEATTKSTSEAVSEHDRYQDVVVQQIARHITNHISFARNVVKPKIVSMVEYTQKFMQDSAPQTAEQDFCINSRSLPDPLEDGLLVDAILKFGDGVLLKPETRLSLDTLSYEEIVELLKTGNKDIDQAIIGWTTLKGEAFFGTVWDSFFLNTEKYAGHSFVTFDDLFGMDIFDKADHALAIYLLADKLFDHPTAGAGYNLSTFKIIVGQYRTMAAVCLADAIRRAESYRKTQLMVMGVNQSKKTITVFSDVYNQWLAVAGKPEYLYGLIISDQPYRSVAAIDEHHDDLMEDFRQYSLFFNANSTLRAFNAFKGALQVGFQYSMTETDPLEVEHTAETVAKINKIFAEELEKLVVSDMDDQFSTVMRLVCRARFFYTDAENILTDIVTASKQNPNINVREAALLAAVNYIVDYVCDQIIVK